MKTIIKDLNKCQPLDLLSMQSTNGGSIKPETGIDVDPVTCILRDWYWREQLLLQSGGSKNAA